jgi:hypothetical protein
MIPFLAESVGLDGGFVLFGLESLHFGGGPRGQAFSTTAYRPVFPMGLCRPSGPQFAITWPLDLSARTQ